MPQKAILSKRQREILDREIKDELIKIIDKYNREYDVAIIYALNELEGYGKKRIKRLYKQIISNRIELRRFYADDRNSDSKIDIFAMEKQLEKKGIYLQQIFDEIATEQFDEINELNNSGRSLKHGCL
jgi:hypothetical protein